MAGYTPVFRSILQSTIWETAPHVKVVWWTMLLMCDKQGVIEGSIPGLARLAVVTREQCIEALEVLMSPDPYSRTSEHEGRRVIIVDGGWKLLNYEKYCDKVGATAQANRERVARHRQKSRDSNPVPEQKAEAPQPVESDSLPDVTPVTLQPLHVTPVTPVTLQPLHVTPVMPVTLPPLHVTTSNDLNVVVTDLDSSLSSGSDARDDKAEPAKIPCPKDLRLTDDQFESLRMDSGIPPWAIEQSTFAFVANFIADPEDKRQLVHWRKCLAKAIVGDWRDPKKKPQKPQPEGQPASSSVADYARMGVVL